MRRAFAVRPTFASSIAPLLLFVCIVLGASEAWAQTWQVASDSRDAWGDGTSGNTDIADFGDVAFADAGGYQWALTIPKNTSIVSAKVRLYSTLHLGSAGAYTVRIRVEDVDSAAAFTGAPNDILTRTYWSTTVDWNIPSGGLPINTWSESPDIAPLIQHIVNRAGWTSGNYLSIAIWGQTSSGGSREVISDFPTNPAELVVTTRASLDQIHYRWRNDDGNEAAATFAAAEDTKLTNVGKNATKRLRFEVSNEGVLSSGPLDFELQVAQSASCAAPTALGKTLSAGESSTCVLLASGGIQCWGNNGSGQLGDGTSTDRYTAVPVSGITNANSVSIGETHACAGFASGTMECWGGNGNGQLGDGTTAPHSTPAPVPGITNASQVMAASYTTCAQLDTGGVECWGNNGDGDLGDGTGADQWSPVSVLGLSDAVQTSVGHYHSCSIRPSGSIECWGNNGQGQIGDNGAPTDRLSPVAVSGLSNIVEVSAGGYHTCARTAADNVYCWGRNVEGQVGDGTFTERHVPVPGPSLSGIVELVAGGYHTCARLDDGTIQCWGRGTEGQLGYGGAADQSSPVSVSGITNAVALAAGHYHTCAILADGDIACWGANWFGEIGDGTTTQRNAPVTWTPSSAPAVANAYSTVPTDTSGHWQITDTSYYTDGDPSTDISPGLTNEATTFVSGELKDTASTTGSITLDADEFTELEFALKATGNATDGSNYCFRLYDATGTQVLDSYSVYAEAKLAGSTYYRSIGTAPDYSAGTITATDGSETVTGTGTSWRAANRGRGDRIDINGTDYTIRWVASDTELTLTTPVSGNFAGAYTISRQFTTLQSWEDCISGAGGCVYFPVIGGNLVSQERKEFGIAYKDSVFTDDLVIDGAITDASYNITLTVDPGNRHSGVAGTGVVVDPASVSAHAIDIRTPYTRVEWLEITGWEGNSMEGVHIEADNTTLEFLLIHGGPETTHIECDGIYVGPDLDMTGTIRNTIVYDVPRMGIHLQNYQGTSTVAFDVENVTVYNCGSWCVHAVANGTANTTLNAVNVIAMGGGVNDFALGGSGSPTWGTSNFNVSADGTAPGASTFVGAAATEFVNVTAGAEDLHLKAGAVSIDKGTDLSAQFTSDIDLQSRPWGAGWDIGADELPPTGSCSVGQSGWYDTQWLLRKEIALNGTKVAGPVSEFPVLINLASDAGLAASAQDPDGDDILFTLSDGITKLSHEIEKFDGTTGELVAWVKVPYLASGADTTIFMYYGNPTAPNQQDVTNVWDPNFVAVWHMKETPTVDPVAVDSASTHDASFLAGMTAGDQVPGQIDGSFDFDALSTDRVTSPDDPTLGNMSNLTVGTWVKVNQLPNYAIGDNSDSKYLAYKRHSAAPWFSWQLMVPDFDQVFYMEVNTTNADWGSVGSNTAPNTTDWFHVVGVYENNQSLRIYVNGVNDVQWVNGSGPTGNIMDSDSDHRFGMTNSAGGTTMIQDELRISNVVRSDAWILTEYNNQSDPSTFYTLCSATTEVELKSFVADGVDGAVELQWETASELDNLGFHLYRSATGQDGFERITKTAIPGLGSSPVGARYSYRDQGLTNGVTYHYKLEDIETSGQTTFHGPVSATPQGGDASTGDDSGHRSDNGESSLITYGDPSVNSLRLVSRSRRGVTLELETGGFYATPQEDGSVRLEIPGFETLADPDAPGIPIRRSWVEAIAGLKVNLVSVTAREVETFTGLRPSNGEMLDVVATPDRTVRVARRRRSRSRSVPSRHVDGLYPADAASIAAVGFQGDVKKALVELAPLRWDAASGRLVLARRLVVQISFRGRERDETSTDGVRGRRYRRRPQTDAVVARLVTSMRGLHAIRYEEVRRDRRGIDASELRLSRLGEAIPFHLEPSSSRFAPGSTLYFVADGAEANPYGNEVIYELSGGVAGERMPSTDAPPSGEPTSYYWHRLAQEQNLLYQAALVDAPDRWLWDLLFAPVVKSYPFEVHALASSSDPSKLEVQLQGASDFHTRPDHHVRVYVNGTFVAESSWDGKRPEAIEIELLPGLLREGENHLELENVGDTDAPYSMVMLDRFAILYPRNAVAVNGMLEGQWSQSGSAELVGLGANARVLDVTESPPRWLTESESGADGVLRFRAEAGRRYLAASEETILRPEVRKVKTSSLKNDRNQADYLVIGPEAFLEVAKPLLDLRARQGLTTKAVPIEDVYSTFGFGEPSPRAVKDFLSYAYHHWRAPSLRYVVLLGDATFDFKDYLGTGVQNRVPPLMVKTTYLWTASDPTYAAVNGDDALPDIAIGRLPAATIEEARAMVDKIVAYETGEASLAGPTVLIADNPDRAGDFEADAEELASGLLAAQDPEKIFVRELGPAAARVAIQQAFDNGVSMMSYFGHGGIHLWASENVLNIRDVASLSPQAQQPLLLTMNCLNGYYHFPYFNALSEELVKAESKGAIAAFSPSGLSLNDPARRYHEALLTELYSGKHERLGDAVLAAQVAYAETGALPELLSIYQLLGDPALKLRQ